MVYCVYGVKNKNKMLFIFLFEIVIVWIILYLIINLKCWLLNKKLFYLL